MIYHHELFAFIKAKFYLSHLHEKKGNFFFKEITPVTISRIMSVTAIKIAILTSYSPPLLMELYKPRESFICLYF